MRVARHLVALGVVLVLSGSAPLYAARIDSRGGSPTGSAAEGQRPGSQAQPSATSPAIPALSGPVVDQAGILSPADERAIAALASELERKTSAEIAVLTVSTTAPADAFDYGLRVAESWKLGKQGRDNGLLMLVAVEDRKVRFFTGYGLEGLLPDGKLGAILDDYVTPRFRAGDYPGGIRAGMRAAADEIARDAGVTLEGESLPPVSLPVSGTDAAELIWLLLFVALFVLPLLFGGRRGRRRGFVPIFYGGGGFGGGFGRGGFGGGGFGGGGSSGGFGGGGRFGGGGAGRGW